MTLIRHEIPISITLISPFATRGLIVDRASIDLPLARNRDKQLILPGTLITGILRAALQRLADAASGTTPLVNEIAALFGGGSKKDTRVSQDAWRVHNEPNRGQLAIRDLVILATDWQEKRIKHRQDYPRIRIDEDLGSVKEGFLQFIEMPFAIGEEVTFEGIIDLKVGTVGPDRAVALLNKALALVPALGAIKSSGFGRLAHTGCEVKPAQPIHATSTPKSLRTGVPLGVTYTIDRPFLAGGRMASANLFKGSAVIPGSAIKGTLAEALQRAGQMTDAMRDLLAAVTIGHVFPKPVPAEPGQKRWRPIPLSLATVHYNNSSYLYDRLRLCLLADQPLEPPRIDRRARTLTFLGDMKDKEPLQRYLGIAWDPPAYDVRTRTKIDPETGAAEYDAKTKSGQLFSYAAVDPAGFDWQGRIVFPADAAPALVGEILALLEQGVVGLGKTGALLKASIGGPVDMPTSDPPYALTLATPAVLNDLEALRDGRSLRDDYAAYWDGLGYTLLTFFAAQRLEGGYVALRYPPRPGACEPYLVTKPGSVFLIKPKGSGDVTPLSDLLTFGLPPRGPIAKPEWENCPFLPQNGFGEVHLNAVDHQGLRTGMIP